MTGRRGGTGWRIRFAMWIALSAACASPLWAVASDVAQRPFLGGYVRETRIVYPLVLADWHAQDERRYEQPEFGVSVRYAGDPAQARHLDVYVYPAGEVMAASLDAHMAQTISELHGLDGQRDGRTIRFGAVDAGRIALEGVDADSADGEMRSASGWMRSGDATYHTALAIAVRQYHFVKARYSVAADATSEASVRSTLAALVAQLVEQIEIVNTGSCGAPFPLVVIDAGSGFPDARLADVTRDEQVRALLTQDFELVTRDPDDPAVALLEAAGKALRQTRYPGCAGETPVEPDVPEGHREIRIEYRAPNAGTGPALAT